MTVAYGIEDIAVYPGTMALDIAELCRNRGTDFDDVQRTLMTDQRSLIPPFEDTVTMAVNAADELMTDGTRDTVELLIVSTESSVDQEKSVSTWVHRWLGLPAHCRNFEVKHACYGATGAMRMALAWLREQGDRPCRALVVGADASLLGFEEPFEPVMGAVSFAILLSASPEFLVVPSDTYGVYAHDVTDVIRPRPNIETGNSETSLFAYHEALEGAWQDFQRRSPTSVDFDADFDHHIYHLPFAGMGVQAHRTLTSLAMGLSRKEAGEHYLDRVEPSLRYSRRIGSSYSASTFIAMLSLLEYATVMKPEAPVSVFAFGSGSCAELYSARFGAKASEIADKASLARKLNGRRPITVADYDACERQRVGAIGAADFKPTVDLVEGLFDSHYAGTGKLILDSIETFERHYRRA